MLPTANQKGSCCDITMVLITAVTITKEKSNSAYENQSGAARTPFEYWRARTLPSRSKVG